MTDRISSGTPRLDAVLGGGLPANSINVVMGVPGTGKTILAQQYLFHNATEERPGIYLSTVSEPLEKTIRYGQSLSFFDPAAVGRRVVYEDVGATLHGPEGLSGLVERVVAIVRERHPNLLVIDSFKALHPFAIGAGEFRRVLHDLAGRLTAYPATSFLVGEYSLEEVAVAPEFAVADGILALGMARTAERETRVFEVLKLRGSSYLTGKHAYRLSESGIEVFPRLADSVDGSRYALVPERTSLGIPLLDQTVNDGFWRGASTLVAGPSGSGKSLLGLHFIFRGVETGEPGLIATLQEHPSQLERIAKGFGWSLGHDDVHEMYRTPVDLYLDEWVYDLLGHVEEHGIRRVLIDSLGDLQVSARDEIRFREYVYSLLQRLSRAGVSVFMTQEVPELFGVTRLSERGISHLSDNVILLQFLRGESRIKRALTVVKTRASRHDPGIVEFDITDKGIEVGKRFADEQSLA